MKQFQAGYLLDNLLDVFDEKSIQKENFKCLTKWSSHFQLTSKSNFEENTIEYSSSIAVLINLIQRGLPTKLNKYAIDFLVNKSSFLSFDDKSETSIVLNYGTNTPEMKELIFRSLHLIDPRQSVNKQKEFYKQSWEKLGSNFEENFLYNDLPLALGGNGAAFIQLLATQRSISSIIKRDIDLKNVHSEIKNNFEEQRSDFSIEFPYYSKNKPKGIIIEVDGQQHKKNEQSLLDIERDKAVAACDWNNTLRIKTSEFGTSQFNNKIKNILIPAINNEYVANCLNNYINPLWNSELGKEILQLCLIPFGVARIQRAILEAIAHNKLTFEKKVWRIAVLERDVPCGQLAIADLKKLITSINKLTNEPNPLPEIELKVFSTNEFLDSTFKIAKTLPIKSFDKSEVYDLIIDVAILDRTSNKSVFALNAAEVIIIRSVHYLYSKRIAATSALIRYKPFCSNPNNSGKWLVDNREAEEGLVYLLQSVFRKRKFLDGQLPIMHNALQCKSVIGLLPTGGGKSLTYQMSSLLQPGLCLVIDPIKSLMKDQVDGLLKNNIDSCIFINSTLRGERKRKAVQKLANGEVQFVFVSPERLQMEEFRDLLNSLYEEGHYFSYCVIDEAHCVSEWGHDFRTAYLRLGENAIRYCKTKNQEHLPLFGLTATASYDVLADVQRELSGNDEETKLNEDAIIRSEYSKRNELQYIIEEVTFPDSPIKDIWDLQNNLGIRKQSWIKKLISNLPDTINKFSKNPNLIFDKTEWKQNEKNEHNTFDKIQIKDFSINNFYQNSNNAILVFCPHTKGIFGVTDKFNKIKNEAPIVRKGYFDVLSSLEGIKAGYFMGSGGNTGNIAEIVQEESYSNQDKFINNELNLMVATKAFGMGIDKENIRCTIHTNYPSSIESFVQESGRAGRDRKIALSYILFNDQKVRISGEDELVDHDLDINMYFHKNSFKGVAKELAVLDELLTEIYFPDKTFELENIINDTFDTNVRCKYWKGSHNKRLYVNLNFNKKLGFMDLDTLNYFLVGTVDKELSTKIFLFIKNYINDLNLVEPVHEWIQKSDNQVGIEEILRSKRNGENFELTIGFYNDVNERIKTLSKWLKSVVHNYFDETTVHKMKLNSTNSTGFIEQVCDYYQKFTRGKILDFSMVCNNRDITKGNPKGTALKMFSALYNGYRDKMDSEKAIYRLSTLGIIDDYTVNFSSNTFTLKGTKKTEKEYKKSLREYLLKYYSAKTTKARLKALDSDEDSSIFKKLLNFLVKFVYNEIQKKRQLAIHDMKTACRLGQEKGSIELKEYIDLYFNSKYARVGYSYFDKRGKEINASLPDITDNGKNDNLKWVWMFMEIIDEDPKAGQIDNLKHLRGACTRMLNNQPDSYTMLLLNAFALYMLEYKNPRYLQEAETLLLNSFTSIQEKEPEWNNNKLEKIFNIFTNKLIDKNDELKIYMEKYGFTFDFDSVMIIRLVKPIQQANNILHTLNEILN